jgi:hypothetical protein
MFGAVSTGAVVRRSQRWLVDEERLRLSRSIRLTEQEA